MSGTTIASSNTIGVALTASAQNPLTVIVGGSVVTAKADAVYGIGTATWSISNLGTIRNNATAVTTPTISNYYGVGLAGYGNVTNGSTVNAAALISAFAASAVRIGGSGTVTNFGSIFNIQSASGVAFGLGGTVVNTGGAANIYGGRYAISMRGGAGQVLNTGTITSNPVSGAGILLRVGGSVTNGASGSTSAVIRAASGIQAYANPTTVMNFGSIYSYASTGVYLATGGTVVNGTIGSTAALISSNSASAVQLRGSAPTVSNFGTIMGATGIVFISAGSFSNQGTLTGASLYGVKLLSGGYGFNALGGVITGKTDGFAARGIATLVNAGSIAALGTTATAGAYLGAGGMLTNGTSGMISGPNAVLIGSTSAAGIVINGGTLIGALSGVFGSTGISAPSTVSNTGSISGATGAGVALLRGGLVNNNGGGTISGKNYGVSLAGTNSSVANYGQIAGAYGIKAVAGGTIVNATTGVINGGSIGVSLLGASRLTNAGTITGTIQGGVYLLGAGSSIVNGNGNPNAQIVGGPQAIRNGVVASTIVNTASIVGTGIGILLSGGGSISNGVQGSAGGVISGAMGIYASTNSANPSTVSNAGTIIGSAGTAVSFASSAAHRLIVLPGAVFQGSSVGVSGLVTAAGTAGNVIELGGTAGSTGSVAGLGTVFTGFQTVTIDAGASWSFGGSDTVANLGNAGTLLLAGETAATLGVLTNNGAIAVSAPNVLATASSLSGSGTVTLSTGTFEVTGGIAAGSNLAFAGTGGQLRLDMTSPDAGTLSGFAAGDLVFLPTYAHHGGDSAKLLAGNTLQVTGGSGSFTLKLSPTDNFTGQVFSLTQHGLGSDLTVACFAEGTRVATLRGNVAVEALRVGDRVLSGFGGNAPVVWLGSRRVAPGRHPDPARLQPIRVRAGAFAPGMPSRDLRLSPDHAVFSRAEGALIPVRCLVNGTSIVQETVTEVTYWHVELPAHDVILAEGLTCESYLDTGNRCAFANGGAAIDLHPDFAQRVWEAEACAPQVVRGPILAAVRARLAACAGGAGREARKKGLLF